MARNNTPVAPAEISIVLQGPVTEHTPECLHAARRHFPGAEIILSTWKGSATAGLDADLVLENEDPGPVIFKNGYPLKNPVNRIIVSSRAGVQAAGRPFILKLRSDLLLTGRGMLDFFGRFRKRSAEWKIFEERVLTSTIFTRTPRRGFYHLHFPYHPSDWFCFGLCGDVRALWELPLVSGSTEMTSEQYIWVSLLRKHGLPELPANADPSSVGYSDMSEETIRRSEAGLANNFVFLEPWQGEYRFVKYDPWKLDLSSVYTFQEWLRLYNRYCGGNERTCPDLTLAYRVARRKIQTHPPAVIGRRIRGLVRRMVA